MTDEINTLHSEYLDDLKLKGRTGQGFDSTKRSSKKFVSYLRENNIIPSEINIQTALDYQTYLSDTGRRDGHGDRPAQRW